VPSEYEPQSYWSSRLDQDFNLRGVGHLEYSVAYNTWLYRRKRMALDRALSGRSAGASALDIGSGVGWVVSYLLQRGFRVSGCDIAEGAVDRLRRTYPAADFFRLTVGTEPIPRDDASLDVITMMDVAYHIVDDGLWQSAIGEFSRVLRPDGQLVVTDGLGDLPVRDAEHVKKRSLRDWEQATQRAGMRVARTGPLFRWLSRPRAARGWHRVPDGPRGAAEFALDLVAPTPSHLRWAVLVKANDTQV
jgi:SAM-dependent methyltransferase